VECRITRIGKFDKVVKEPQLQSQQGANYCCYRKDKVNAIIWNRRLKGEGENIVSDYKTKKPETKCPQKLYTLNLIHLRDGAQG